MNEVIRNELKNWCETLNIDDLNEYDISVINIILNHYDELIEAGGTAGGKGQINLLNMLMKKRVFVIRNWKH